MSKRANKNDRQSRHADGNQHNDGSRYDHQRHDNDEPANQRQERRHAPAPAPHASETDNSHRLSQAPDRVEEVWMKEKRGRISFNDSDLVNIARPKAKNSNISVAGVAGVAAMLGLIGFLALSSTPDLMPHEIIAMRGYEGEQATKTPFNLASLRDCNDVNTCAEQMKPPANTHNTEQATQGATDNTTGNATTVDQIPLAKITNESPTPIADRTELQEIPAATVLPAFTEDTVEEQPTQLRVLKQWSNVRSSPDVNSTILTSLATGTNVTLLNQTGNWFKVSAFKRKEFIGYMHRSTVAVQ